MGYIYLITNFQNQKNYIGQTVNPISHRWREHVNEAYDGNKSNSLLHRAIVKYGASSFGICLLEECKDSELNEKEKFYIKEYDSYYTHDKGYNMTWGGEGVIKYNDDEILYLWNQGYRNCEIARLLGAKDTTISLRIQSLVGSGAAQTRRADSRKISIIQYDLQGNYVKDWESVSIAEKELNLSQGSISRCCNKQRTNSGNFLWKKSNDDTPVEELMLNYAKSMKCCAVDLIDDYGNIIKTYESGKAAELELGIARGRVSEVCNGKYGRKTANGYKFQWNYKVKREIYNGIK